VKIAVAAVAAGTALTACGPAKIGAAAIVGHDRITVAKVDSAVTEWAKELPKHPQAQQIVQQAQSQGQGQGQQIPFDPSSPQRSALHQLLDFRAWDEVAREHRMSPTPGQVDQFVAQNGGQPAVDANILAQGLPTKYGEEFARTILIQRTLITSYSGGVQPTDPQRQQQVINQLLAAYTQAKHALHITVNPRYGTLDQSLSLGPVCPRLSIPDSGTGEPANEVKCPG
jgi:hypothetical protein